MPMHVVIHGGCMITIWEFALKASSGRIIVWHTGESNLHQQFARPTLNQLSHILPLPGFNPGVSHRHAWLSFFRNTGKHPFWPLFPTSFSFNPAPNGSAGKVNTLVSYPKAAWPHQISSACSNGTRCKQQSSEPQADEIQWGHAASGYDTSVRKARKYLSPHSLHTHTKRLTASGFITLIRAVTLPVTLLSFVDAPAHVTAELPPFAFRYRWKCRRHVCYSSSVLLSNITFLYISDLKHTPVLATCLETTAVYHKIMLNKNKNKTKAGLFLTCLYTKTTYEIKIHSTVRWALVTAGLIMTGQNEH